MLSEDTLDRIEAFAIAAGFDTLDARRLTRRFAQGDANADALPAPSTEAGKAEHTAIIAAIKAAATTPAADADSMPQSAKPETSSPMSLESRRVLFRQMAGARLTAFADALAESPATFEEARNLIAIARADLPPESGLPPGYVTIEERAAGAPEFGASWDVPMSKQDRAKDGWARAVAAVNATRGG